MRNGKIHRGIVCRNTIGYFIDVVEDGPFIDLQQNKYKQELNTKYKNNGLWPNAPTLDELTQDLNKLITLPDLSVKQ